MLTEQVGRERVMLWLPYTLCYYYDCHPVSDDGTLG